MQNDILSPNRIVVNTLSPLHIGTGERYKPIDFLVSTDGTVHILDDTKILRWVSSDARLAAEFVTLAEQGKPLSAWIKDHGSDPGNFVAYRVKSSLQPGDHPEEILKYIQSPTHQPYLPGSSLKGSLRSSLLRGVTMENPGLRQKAGEIVTEAAERRRRDTGSEAIEAGAFVMADVQRSRYSNYDLNRLLIIRDSLPRTSSDLEVVEVRTFSSSGRALLPKSYAIFAEVLRSKLTLHHALTWQTYLLDQAAAEPILKLDQQRRLMAFLPEYCRAASLGIMAQEIDFYYRHAMPGMAGWYETRRDQLKSRSDSVFALPLGWGSGYDAKTITDLLGEAVFEVVVDTHRNTKGLGRPGNNRDNPWLGAALSPKSRKLVVRSDQAAQPHEPLGWLAVDFRAEPDDWFQKERQRLADQRPVIEIPEPATRRPDAPPVPTEALPPTLPDQPIQPAPAEPLKPPPPPPRPLIRSFSKPPQPGDRFLGIVFEVSGRELYLSLPGLDSDNQAYAYVPAEENTGGKTRNGAEELCEVLSVAEERPGYWQVVCRRE